MYLAQFTRRQAFQLLKKNYGLHYGLINRNRLFIIFRFTLTIAS